MDPNDFLSPDTGRLVKTVEGAWAFVPSPLPPAIELSWELVRQVIEAERSVANLRGVGATLPNPHLLIQPFVRREAVLSSRIEGTQATVEDLALFELDPPHESSDVHEVSNYVGALEYGLKRSNELPLSLRLIREVHSELMTGVRGGDRNPGEFRRQQNWIGGAGSTLAQATYVPPPVLDMTNALHAFERYLHARSPLPSLVRLALLHYQFEAIHPFLDGNGRVGRLLTTFLLQMEGLMDQPLLYLSAYFERNRDEYYRRLLDVSQRGAWPEWVAFFMTGVTEQAGDAVDRSSRLLALWREYRKRVTSAKNSALLGAIVDGLFAEPAVTIAVLARRLRITYPSAKANVEKLVKHRILAPVEGRSRNRIYYAKEIVDLVEA